jgi:hypothetical protein
MPRPETSDIGMAIEIDIQAGRGHAPALCVRDTVADLTYDEKRASEPALPGRVDIVATSVGRGGFVSSYAELIADTGARDLARLVVIPDRKTPRELYQAAIAARRRGLQVIVPTLEEQENLLAQLGASDFVPWNSDNRRNVAYLLAWMSDAEYVVSIDDDNLPIGREMLSRHAVVTAERSLQTVVGCDSGWFNPCDMLEFEGACSRVFARGYPYSRRRPEQDEALAELAEVPVRMNAGLWRGDPDVDAVTRLAVGPVVRSVRRDPVVLERNTWAPVNTQNTAVHRDVLPAYWFVRMGQRMFGHQLDRFGDIFSGYFAQACAKHLGHAVRFGDPITWHVRNRHVLLQDLQKELPGILLLEDLAEWLRECKLEGSTYSEAYLSLSHMLEEGANQREAIARTADARRFLHETALGMRRWVELLTDVAN